MKLMAIDPGSTHSAYAEFQDGQLIAFAKVANEVLEGCLYAGSGWDHVVIETITSRGIMPNEAVRTAVWVGRFIGAFSKCVRTRFTEVTREKVRGYFCGTHGDDARVRNAIIDRYGGARAIGGVKCPQCKGRRLVGLGKARGPCGECEGSGWEIPPGPLADVRADMWSAIAIGCYWLDTHAAVAKGA